ncbi:uncharacterized protein [Littorina saxatilis]|uniref:uncharacterized protein n=1 Tax=Littorina saxatilis TaxID=31220 RepID=UPI0038B56820
MLFCIIGNSDKRPGVAQVPEHYLSPSLPQGRSRRHLHNSGNTTINNNSKSYRHSSGHMYGRHSTLPLRVDCDSVDSALLGPRDTGALRGLSSSKSRSRSMGDLLVPAQEGRGGDVSESLSDGVPETLLDVDDDEVVDDVDTQRRAHICTELGDMDSFYPQRGERKPHSRFGQHHAKRNHRNEQYFRDFFSDDHQNCAKFPVPKQDRDISGRTEGCGDLPRFSHYDDGVDASYHRDLESSLDARFKEDSTSEHKDLQTSQNAHQQCDLQRSQTSQDSKYDNEDLEQDSADAVRCPVRVTLTVTSELDEDDSESQGNHLHFDDVVDSPNDSVLDCQHSPFSEGFGKRSQGCGRRTSECLTLESSEMIAIDYPDVQALKGGHPHHRNIHSANVDRLLAPDIDTQHDLRGGMRRMNSDSGIEQVRMQQKFFFFMPAVHAHI